MPDRFLRDIVMRMAGACARDILGDREEVGPVHIALSVLQLSDPAVQRHILTAVETPWERVITTELAEHRAALRIAGLDPDVVASAARTRWDATTAPGLAHRTAQWVEVPASTVSVVRRLEVGMLRESDGLDSTLPLLRRVLANPPEGVDRLLTDPRETSGRLAGDHDEAEPGTMLANRFRVLKTVNRTDRLTRYRLHDREWAAELSGEVRHGGFCSMSSRAAYGDRVAAWAGLGSHPNVVQCFGGRDLSGTVLTVTENWDTTLAEARIPWVTGDGDGLAQIAHVIASGLNQFHTAGLTHGSVGMESVVVHGDRVKLRGIGASDARGMPGTVAADLRDWGRFVFDLFAAHAVQPPTELRALLERVTTRDTDMEYVLGEMERLAGPDGTAYPESPLAASLVAKALTLESFGAEAEARDVLLEATGWQAIDPHLRYHAARLIDDSSTAEEFLTDGLAKRPDIGMHAVARAAFELWWDRPEAAAIALGAPDDDDDMSRSLLHQAIGAARRAVAPIPTVDGPVDQIAWGAGDLIAVAARGEVYLVDASTGDVATWRYDGPVNALAVVSNDEIAVLSEGTVRWLRVGVDDPVGVLDVTPACSDCTGFPNSLTVAPDGAIWLLTDRAELVRIDGEGRVTDRIEVPLEEPRAVVAIGADRVVVVGDDGYVHDRSSPVEYDIDGDPAVAAVSPDGTILATMDGESPEGPPTIRLTDLVDGVSIPPIPVDVEPPNALTGFAVSNDACLAAWTAGVEELVVVDLSTSRVLITHSLDEQVRSLRFSADGNAVIVVGASGTVRSVAAGPGRWRMPDLQPVPVQSPLIRATIRPDLLHRMSPGPPPAPPTSPGTTLKLSALYARPGLLPTIEKVERPLLAAYRPIIRHGWHPPSDATWSTSWQVDPSGQQRYLMGNAGEVTVSLAAYDSAPSSVDDLVDDPEQPHRWVRTVTARRRARLEATVMSDSPFAAAAAMAKIAMGVCSTRGAAVHLPDTGVLLPGGILYSDILAAERDDGLSGLLLIGLDLDVDAETCTFRSRGLAALGSPEVTGARRLPATSTPFRRKALLRKVARDIRNGLAEVLSYGSVIAPGTEVTVKSDLLVAHAGDDPAVLRLSSR
ncbi:hypothetical protein FB566_4083 [Stackebrandtia endophytica]|uniref:Protein kinase domain-containing protein n=1 Tax=Stackebrandtia endophytica TaxID=1496996 RepID=A0A543B0X8_9ACTN|nr:hypothetical protein [Stackebrandtia endophytica]TQL78495.1 hypothetical protein FB566_4083 [Stackebrandtia endophytica]